MQIAKGGRHGIQNGAEPFEALQQSPGGAAVLGIRGGDLIGEVFKEWGEALA